MMRLNSTKEESKLMTIKLVKKEDGSTEGTMTGTLQWVSFLKPKTNKFKPGSTQYSVEVESTADDDLKQLKAAGATKKTFRSNEQTGEFYLGPTGKKLISFTTPGEYPDGKSASGPLVLDATGKRVTVEVGNGSEGVVQFVIKKGKNSEFASTRLVAIKITKLVPFVRTEKSGGPDADLLGLTKSQLEEATKSLDDDLDSTLNTPSILS